MPKPDSSPEILERALDLAWSLWAELGVAGWRRRHQDWGIDPEPLVIFSAWAADLDPRLRDESLDWCITFGHYLSRARLRNLLRASNEATISAFGTYAATVNAHSALNWPHATRARNYKPTKRSDVQDFTEASLLALRLRALFGVSARAETIRVLMGPISPLTTADIARQIDYTKRNVADALESLRLAGLVFTERQGNVVRFRLNRQEVRTLVTPLPKLFPSWKSIFRIVARLLEVDAREEGLTKAARAVEARVAVESVKPEIMTAGLREPDPSAFGEDYWDAFMAWAIEVMTGLAFAEASRAFDAERAPRYL